MKARLNHRACLAASSLICILMSATLSAQQTPQFTDDDGDGIISAQEITQVQDAQRASRLAQYDVDGNGELSRLERRAMKDASYEQMLSNFDADGDGEISRAERRAARDARRVLVEEQLDVNQDGELSALERAGFEQVMDERQDRRHGKGGNKRHADHGPEQSSEELPE